MIQIFFYLVSPTLYFFLFVQKLLLCVQCSKMIRCFVDVTEHQWHRDSVVCITKLNTQGNMDYIALHDFAQLLQNIVQVHVDLGWKT